MDMPVFLDISRYVASKSMWAVPLLASQPLMVEYGRSYLDVHALRDLHPDSFITSRRASRRASASAALAFISEESIRL